MKWLVTLCFLTTVSAAVQSGPQDAAGMIAALQGSWTITHVNGQSLGTLGQNSSITFTRDGYTVTTNGQVKERGLIKVDGTTKPMQIDLRITEGIAAGKTQIGIVQVVSGTLTLKTNTIGTPKRPTDFKDEPWYVMFVARRK
jgi:uncharacterized protein (TIGR03067 family)